MPGPITITLSPENAAFAEAQIRAGRFPNVETVVNQALDLLHDAPFAPEPEALKALLAERMAGPFLSEAESEQAVQEMLAALENDERI